MNGRRLVEGLGALACGLLATAAWWAVLIAMLPSVGDRALAPARGVVLSAPRRDARDPQRCIVVLDERGRTCIICQVGGVVTMSGEGC